MLLDDIYNCNKRGTIVIGLPRSGTHYLKDIIVSELIEQSILPAGSRITQGFEIMSNLENTSFKDPISMFEEELFASRTEYAVRSIIATQPKLYLHNLLATEFHTIALRRKDVMEHFMSWCIRIFLQEEQSTYYVDQATMCSAVGNLHLLCQKQLVEQFIIDSIIDRSVVTDVTLFYEDILGYQSNYKKNQYGITPDLFFTNYDEIVYLFNLAGLLR